MSDPTRRLAEAGADHLVFNSPLSEDRAEALADQMLEGGVRAVVDLGCGQGALARLFARRSAEVRVLGVEVDAKLVERARRLTEADGLADRVTFAVADAAAWTGAADAAVCIGASHVFGGTRPMLDRLAEVVGMGVALVGEGFWAGLPTDWCLETFGPLPDGLDGLVAVSAAAGWSVERAESSSQAEWDAFEHGWREGVRGVGTPEAVTFADEREHEYQRYREVLGFGWLLLRRS